MATKTTKKSSPKTPPKKVSAKVVTETKVKVVSENLHPWNKYLAVLHAAQGVIILILSATRSFPVTTSYLGTDTLQTQAQGHAVLAAGSQHLFDLNLAYLVAAFFFAAAIAHGLAATVLRPAYEQDVKQGINKIRWAEYAVSSSIMVVAIGLLVGVRDLSTLLMLFGLVAVANMFGLVTEMRKLGNQGRHWVNYVIASIAGVLPWVIIAIYLIGDAAYGASVAGYVYWIVGTMLLLALAAIANALLLYFKVGKWANYLYGERVYMLVSLVAKSALAWQIFAGTLHP